LLDDIDYASNKPAFITFLMEIFEYVINNKIKLIATSSTKNNQKFKFDKIININNYSIDEKKKIVFNVLNRENSNILLTNQALAYLVNKTGNNMSKLYTNIDMISYHYPITEKTIITKSQIENILCFKKIGLSTCLNTIKIICEYFKINPQTIFEKNKSKKCILIRQICIYFLYKKNSASTRIIADIFTNYKTRSILCNHCKFLKKIKSTPTIIIQLNNIQKLL
jgi:chromosomal replication initiation ATPase DnaA